MKSDSQKTKYIKAKEIFKTAGGILKTTQARRLGIHTRTLYAMRDAGIIEKVSRGVYRLADLPPLSNPDLATVAMRSPKGVICLISALSFHEITTQIPHEVYLAIPRTKNNVSQAPRIDFPPVRTFHFMGKSFTEGIQEHMIDNVPVKIYNQEKTIADCFKYRNKIGLETTLEALKFYRRKREFNVNKIMYYAEICRVKRIMKPYLEALI